MPIPASSHAPRTRSRFALAILLVGACTTWTGAAFAAEASIAFRGYAYDLGSNKFLYTELHEQKLVDDRWVGGSIAYYAPDGSQLAYKTLDFAKDPHIPLFRLEMKVRGGYVEGITDVSADSVELLKQDYGQSKPKQVTIKRKGLVTADSGFHPFIRDHFKELESGKVVPFSFAVAGNLDKFKFRAKRIADGTFEGKPVVRFLIEPDSLLRWLVDPLEISYDAAQRRLLEYKGVSNIHDPATGKAYIVRIIYPSKPPEDAPALTLK